MCASSPGLGSRSSPKQQANIKTYTFKSKEIQTALSTFIQILHSCYGPAGHPKIIQNSSGGYITTTSASTQLLQNLTVSKPVLKLMVAAVQGHLSRFGDGGLYCGLLMSHLVDTCANVDLHPVLCISINEHLMRRCLEILHSVKIPVDVSNMETMLSVVRSVIRTKPLCNLTGKELNYISTLVLEAFLKAIPSFESNTEVRLSYVECMAVEGVPPLKSCVLDGVLLEATRFMTVMTKNITMQRVQSGQRHGQIRVALYDISMSGDSQNFADVNYEMLPGVSANEAVLSQMLTAAEKLVHEEVGLVACQKVIHPSLKKFLKEKGVWTLDRLSRLHIDAVQRVTGAQILSTFSPDLPGDCFGYLDGIELVEMFNKTYIHLQNGHHPICTLALCSRTGVALEELKNVCNVANQTLALILSNPMVLPGAGCTETYIASKLHQAMTSINESLLTDLGCTHAQYLTVARNVALCFHAVAKALEHDHGSHVTDTVNHHRYAIPPGIANRGDWLTRHNKCACGMKTFQSAEKLDGAKELITTTVQGADHVNEKLVPNASKCPLQKAETGSTAEGTYINPGEQASMVLDCLPVKQNALCVAVETANVVLRIKHTIEDAN